MKSYKFKINENGYAVNIKSHDKNIINLEVNGTSYVVEMKEEIKKTKTPTLVRAAAKKPTEPIKVNPKSQKTRIVAPIPGVVLSIEVKVGDTLKIGDRMLVLEAMKMENNIVCEKIGTITAINISVGQQVLQNELMIELE